ncbi:MULTISPECIES: GPP34 family phosphoprotein [unclassified Brevibacterium]|uniref:GPP34 family phosphoprotein n=1 Tax=unclassified Brevibacterium TaxID=2614124 RepID=UPI001E579092|nr:MULTISPECIES: GPP34 family phosphoprotein [unclassified Brevibacterium]MDK8433923.1 GPP34 family phosphoprotein [Brevibacterium sp. H-BE7]
MNEDLLIVEDLMLLLLSEDGNSVAGAAVLDYALAGAVLVELAHLERLEVHSHHRTKGTLIRAQRDASAIDPLLAQALQSLGRKEHSARTLIPTLIDSLETGLKKLVLERLSHQ